DRPSSGNGLRLGIRVCFRLRPPPLLPHDRVPHSPISSPRVSQQPEISYQWPANRIPTSPTSRLRRCSNLVEFIPDIRTESLHMIHLKCLQVNILSPFMGRA
ncbi:unnamed protein product, partial [Musa acuminata var. zebrina]